MKHWLVFLFLVVVVNPYSGKGIDYGEDESQLYEYETDKRIIVVEPEKDESETKFTDAEIDRFIQKAKSIINYSPYVYQNSQEIDE